MDQTSGSNSKTTEEPNSGSTISPTLGIIAAVVVVIAALLALGPCILNRRRQRPEAQADVESHADAVNGVTNLQTLNSTSPAQNYKVSQVSKSQTGLARHKSDSLEVCAICLEVFGDSDVVRRLKCAHVFHSQCIDLWLQRMHFNCPLCKSVYVARPE